MNFTFYFHRSRLHGRVVDSLLKGEHITSGFSLTPLKGDCGESPLLLAKITGTLSL